MKILSWMRSRINGNKTSAYHNSTRIQHPALCKDEFSDCPNGLLAIGTFGNANSVEDRCHLENNSAPEAFEHDLKALLNKCVVLDDSIDKFLDSLRQEEKTSCELVHTGSKDVCKNNKRSSISKKSLSYLLKKAFLCKGGFAPTPFVRDLLPHPKLDDTSRMDKILRAMVHKKIYPQRPSQTTKPPKYLDKPEMGSYEEETSAKSKWDKTDSEYIVLEI